MKQVRLLVVLLSYLFACSAYAAYEAPRAAVDVIIFEQLGRQEIDEQPKYPGEVSIKDAKFLSDLAEKDFIVLDEEEHNLDKEAKSLSLSKNFKVIEHYAWEQEYSELSKNKVLLPEVPEELRDDMSSLSVFGTVLVIPHGANSAISVDFSYKNHRDDVPARISARKILPKGQILYLDNPRFGILLKVSDAKKPLIPLASEHEQLKQLVSE